MGLLAGSLEIADIEMGAMMDYEEVTKYRTADGQEFDSEDEAHAYAAEKKLRAAAHVFAVQHRSEDDGKTCSPRTMTARENLVVAWEQWKAEQGRRP